MIVDSLVSEFDREMATTRRLLERVPDDRFDWRPHPKSMTLGDLASHIADMTGWGIAMLTSLDFDLAGAPAPSAPASRQDLLALFDRNVAAVHYNFAGKTDGELLAIWTLRRERETMFTMPRVSVLRGFLLNHVIHHRGQLSVYLRLNDVPLPSIYGPTADEAH